jgi:hypothetical protein
MMDKDETTSGTALPAPDVPFNEITGAYEVWFLTSSLHANPVGDNDVAVIKSDTSIYKINDDALWVAPVGELNTPPTTWNTSFLIKLN